MYIFPFYSNDTVDYARQQSQELVDRRRNVFEQRWQAGDEDRQSSSSLEGELASVCSNLF
jgi:hypothetical protein